MKKQFRSFEKARKFAQSLKLKNIREWDNYCKLDVIPNDIPKAPDQKYKNNGWINWGDFLGTGTVAPKDIQFKPFFQAKQFVHSLGIKSLKEWREYSKSQRPTTIPGNPEKIYKNKGWKGYGDWLGTGTVATFNIKYRSFEKAREYVHSLGITNQRKWVEYAKSGKKPDDIPSAPQKPYKNKGWINYGDWLGTGTIRHRDRKYWSFEKAREYVHSLGIKNSKVWREYTKSGRLPKEIPANPNQVYKNKGWVSNGDWFGTGSVASYLREYWSFEKAREYVHNLKIKSQREWVQFIKSGKLPKEIPANANTVYSKNGWKGYGDWLGTGRLQTQSREYWSFEKAREYVHNLKIKSQREWRIYTKSGKLPKEIPADPHKVWKNKGWKGIGDWLGTGSIRPGDIDYLEFNEAKKIVRELSKKYNIKTNKDWTTAVKKGLIPKNIPKAPWYVYSKKRIKK